MINIGPVLRGAFGEFTPDAAPMPAILMVVASTGKVKQNSTKTKLSQIGLHFRASGFTVFAGGRPPSAAAARHVSVCMCV